MVVPLEGAVIGDTVLASLLPGPYTDKGTLADEVEMDGLAVSARVPGNGQVEIFYTSPTMVKGKFNIEVQRWQ